MAVRISIPQQGYNLLPEIDDLGLEKSETDVFAKFIGAQGNLLRSLKTKSMKRKNKCLLQKYKHRFAACTFAEFCDYLPEDSDRGLTAAEVKAFSGTLHGVHLSKCTQTNLDNSNKSVVPVPSTSAAAISPGPSINPTKKLKVVLHDISQDNLPSHIKKKLKRRPKVNFSEEDKINERNENFRDTFHELAVHLNNLTQKYGSDSLLSGYLKK